MLPAASRPKRARGGEAAGEPGTQQVVAAAAAAPLLYATRWEETKMFVFAHNVLAMPPCRTSPKIKAVCLLLKCQRSSTAL